nr:MAG TPA_asm: hypothetical protein [Caudoviricetes sp.]
MTTNYSMVYNADRAELISCKRIYAIRSGDT